jgi:anti-sigma-K factor RskA
MTFGKKPRLSFESLEMRSLMSGIHAVEAHDFNSHVPPLVGSHGHGGAHANSVTNLRASLSDPTGTSGITGHVQYQSRTHHGATNTALRVNIEGGTAGDVIDVTVDGTSVGQITVRDDGSGALRLKSGAPTASAGSVITLSQTTTDDSGADVTTVLATGTLVGKGKPASTHVNTHLVASATDDASGVSVRSVYQSESEHGHTESNLVVQIRAATAGDVIDISITDSAGNTTSLGTATVNGGGNAHLVLHNSSTAVAAGSTLSLSTVNDDGSLTPLTSATFASRK